MHLPNATSESQNVPRRAEFITGQVVLFGGPFAVAGFYECSGLPLQISQHSVLYSVIGTTYGGNGRVTYRLPDLKGRVPLHNDRHHQVGSAGGTETVTLTKNQLARHHHYATDIDLPVSEAEGTEQDPSGNLLTTDPHGGGRGAKTIYADGNESAGAMQVEGTTDDTGRGDEHTNMQPYLSVSYQICMDGIFPTR
nr:tail fiber protein [Salinirubrum litoreum]